MTKLCDSGMLTSLPRCTCPSSSAPLPPPAQRCLGVWVAPPGRLGLWKGSMWGSRESRVGAPAEHVLWPSSGQLSHVGLGASRSTCQAPGLYAMKGPRPPGPGASSASNTAQGMHVSKPTLCNGSDRLPWATGWGGSGPPTSLPPPLVPQANPQTQQQLPRVMRRGLQTAHSASPGTPSPASRQEVSLVPAAWPFSRLGPAGLSVWVL